MSIRHAMLGLLTDRPLSGYDLKKRMASSTILYWSGNNNQIYSNLIQLNKEGLVTYEIYYDEGAPAKKLYSITEAGRSELKNWLLSPTDPPENQNPFHIRLLWMHLLKPEEIENLLINYEAEVQMRLIMQKEAARRERMDNKSEGIQKFFLKSIQKNIVTFYENELTWVRDLRDNFSISTEGQGGSGQ